MPIPWTVICSGVVAAGSVAVLLMVNDSTLDGLVGAVFVVALAGLARTAIRFAAGPAAPRGEDEDA